MCMYEYEHIYVYAYVHVNMHAFLKMKNQKNWAEVRMLAGEASICCSLPLSLVC